MNKNTFLLILRSITEEEKGVIKNSGIAKSNIYSIIKNDGYTYYNIESKTITSLEEECFKQVNEFGHKKIKQKSIIDYLSYEGKTYWYYLRFSLYFYYLPIFKEVNFIKDFIKEKKSINTVVYTNYNHNIDNVSIIASSNNVKKTSKVNLMKFTLIFFLRAFQGFYKHFFIKKHKHAILIEPQNQQEIIDIENHPSIIYGDYYNEYLTNEALKDKDFCFISDFYPVLTSRLKFKKAYFFGKYSKHSINYEFYFLLTLLNPSNILKYKKNFSFFKKSFSELSKISSNEYDKIILNFIKSKSGLLTYVNARNDAAKLLFKLKKTKTITCHHEHSYNHAPIINAAKEMNIPNFAFQHGIIHPFHPHYIFYAKDKSYNPLPQYTIVWGEYWKQILINYSIYTDLNTFVIGQTRTDIIPKLQKATGIRKTTIVYASQHAQTDAETETEIRKKLAYDFLELTKQYPNINFIIKPHPGEKDAEEYFTKIASKINASNFTVTRSDLYLILNNCDCLLTYRSTVASEAIYFKKPVIILDYEKNDLYNYNDYPGVVFKAEDFKSLCSLVDLIKKNTLHVDKNMQELFISNFAYKINGDVSKNYLNFIKKYS